MIGRPALLLVLIGALVAAAAAGKLSRYATAPTTPAAHSNGDTALVTRALTEAGWRLVATETGDRIPFPSLKFARDSCRHQIVIGLLGVSTELVPLVTMVHRDDVAFVDAGQLVDAKHVTRRRIATLRDLTAADQITTLPLLAIAPATVLREPGCDVPLRRSRKVAGK